MLLRVVMACLFSFLLSTPFYQTHKRPRRTVRGSRNNKEFRGGKRSVPGREMDTHSVLAVLGPVSPALAAYHYLRSPTDNPASRCSRCGHLLVPGTSHSRIVPSSATQRRKKARPSPNTPIVHCLRQSCATCGHVNNTHLSYFHTRNVIAPTSRLYPAVTVTPCTDGTDQCPPPDPPPQPAASPQPQPPIKSRKARPKHKAGLQEMLARNRERQHEAANRGTSGLTTFLHS